MCVRACIYKEKRIGCKEGKINANYNERKKNIERIKL